MPQTEEELEDFGELAERENIAKKYVDSIRTRKVLEFVGYTYVRGCLLSERS